MTTDLVIPSDSGVTVRGRDAVDRLKTSWDIIPHATPQTLVDLCIFAEAAREAGRVRDSLGLVRVAVETRLRAEYRIGQLWREDDALADEFSRTMPRYCRDLGNVPAPLFEAAVAALVHRDKLQGDRSCAARRLMASARVASLKEVEPLIWIAYDGSYYSKCRNGKWTPRLSWDIEQARRWLEDTRKRAKKPWAHVRLDKKYSEARNLADDLSRLKKQFSGEARKAIGEAELFAAKAAESIDRAIREGS